MYRLFGVLWLMEAGLALYFLIWLLNVLTGGDWYRQLALHSRRPAGGGFKSHRLHKVVDWFHRYWGVEE